VTSTQEVKGEANWLTRVTKKKEKKFGLQTKERVSPLGKKDLQKSKQASPFNENAGATRLLKKKQKKNTQTAKTRWDASGQILFKTGSRKEKNLAKPAVGFTKKPK